MSYSLHYDYISTAQPNQLDSFDCGDEGLNNFLKEDALKEFNKHTITTKIVYDNINNIIGYFSLRNASLLFKPDRKGYRGIPALEITYLAIQKKYQYKGMGTYVLKSIIGDAIRYSREFSAIQLIVLKSLKPAVGFYEKNQFHGFPDFFDLPYEPDMEDFTVMGFNLA